MMRKRSGEIWHPAPCPAGRAANEMVSSPPPPGPGLWLGLADSTPVSACRHDDDTMALRRVFHTPARFTIKVEHPQPITGTSFTPGPCLVPKSENFSEL